MSTGRSLHPEVRGKMEEPQEGEVVEVVVVPTPSGARDLSEIVGNCDGEVIDDELPFGMLKAVIPESKLEDLWSESDHIRGIHPPGQEISVLS